MTIRLDFNRSWLKPLLERPESPLPGNVNGNKYKANILIAHYRQNVEKHYRDIIKGSLASECQNANMLLPFEHLGVQIHFDNATEVDLYDAELMINPGLCELVRQAGIVVFQNVYLQSTVREYGHRNRFPHLQFHIDRSAKQKERYSMYTRDPFDQEQKYPRTSSTLFIANIVGQLQGIKEGKIDRNTGENIITTSPFFEQEPMDELIGKVVLEQRWDQAEGIGEIAIIDNATLLHASFYRDALRSGYKIGVRYLAGFETP